MRRIAHYERDEVHMPITRLVYSTILCVPFRQYGRRMSTFLRRILSGKM